jgi:hypothetical protein
VNSRPVLIRNSMEQSPSQEADSCSVCQEISRILQTPEGLLPCTQGLATGNLPGSDESSPHVIFSRPDLMLCSALCQ